MNVVAKRMKWRDYGPCDMNSYGNHCWRHCIWYEYASTSAMGFPLCVCGCFQTFHMEINNDEDLKYALFVSNQRANYLLREFWKWYRKQK